MNYTVKNGHKISALTLGTVQFGLAYGINNDKGMPSFEESARIIDTALNEGIVSFDTARGYGESESVLGRYFKTETREKTIITKVIFNDVEAPRVKDTLFTMLGEAKAKLGLERIPFLKLHNESMLIQYGDTIVKALHDAKAEGLVDGIGVMGAATDLSSYVEWCDKQTLEVCGRIASAIRESYGSSERMSQHSVCRNAAKLTMPCLFYHGAEDPIIPVSQARRLAGVMAESSGFFYREIYQGDHDSPCAFMPEVLDLLLKKLPESEKQSVCEA